MSEMSVVLALGLAALVAAGGAAGAEDVGDLAGTVTDAADNALPGVVVEASCPAQSPRSATTSHDGRYMLNGLKAGLCDVVFQLSGFAASRQPVEIQAGQTAHAQATLRLTFSAQVVVSGRSTFSELATVGSREELVGVAEAASVGVVPGSQLEDRSIKGPTSRRRETSPRRRGQRQLREPARTAAGEAGGGGRGLRPGAARDVATAGGRPSSLCVRG